MKNFITGILLGISSTALNQFATPVNIADDVTDSFLKTEDFNNDTYEDVLLLSRGTNILRVYFNDGNGNMSINQEITASFTNPSRLVVGDVDNDGWLDFITLVDNSGVKIALYRGSSTGVFGNQEIIYSAPGSAADFCLTDYNGDAYPELAVQTDYGSLILLDNLAGTFQAGQTVQSGLDGLANNPTSKLQSIDMDNDGDEDIMTDLEDASMIVPPNGFPLYAVWFRNDGGSYTMIHYDIRQSNSDVRRTFMADLTGDTLPDYISFAENSTIISWFDSQSPPYTIGSGFGTGNSIQAPGTISLKKWNEIVFADFNGDNALDFVAHDLTDIYLYLNNGSSAFTPIVIYDEANSTNLWSNEEQFHFQPADMNGDGDLDLVVTGLADDDFFWLENDGALNFTQHLVAYNASTPGVAYPFDLNGDGYTDVIAKYERKYGLHKFIGNSPTTFEPNVPVSLNITGPPPDSDVFESDMDGDGDLDLILVKNKWDSPMNNFFWYENSATDPFSVQYEVSIPLAKGMRVADIDNDQIDDLVVAGFYEIYIMYGLGSGNFSAPQIVQPIAVTDIYVQDMDSDGLLDIVYPNSGLRIIKNLGGQNYAAPTGSVVALTTWSGLEKRADFGDFNNDGLLDVVGTSAGLFNANVYLNQGNLTFAPPVLFFNTWSLTWKESQMNDVDQDGDLDIVSTFQYNNGNNYEWAVKWHENTGNGTGFIEHPILGGIPNLYDFYLKDMDFDGDPDIMLAMPYDKIYTIANGSIAPYQIDGNIFLDLNVNGVRESNEPAFPFSEVDILPLGNSSFTNYEGNYFFSVDTGTYVIGYSNIDTTFWQLTTDSTSYTIVVDTFTSAYTGYDFGFAPLYDSTIIMTTIQGIQTGCNLGVSQNLVVRNEGGNFPEGVIIYEVDTNVVINGLYPPPDSVQGNMVYWHFDSLFYFEEYNAMVQVTTPGFNPVIDSLRFTLTTNIIDSLGNIELTFQEYFAAPFTCAYDPNNKVPGPYGYTSEGFILPTQEFLEYTVNFQNTGTDTAFNVKITDHLSPYLDWNSFEVLVSSDEVNTSMSAGGEILFDFIDINLPDSATNMEGSKGYVKYRIGLSDSLAPGTVINNFAAIYFDQNTPIVTNTTTHTIFDCNWLAGVAADSLSFCQNDSSLLQSTGQYIENYIWSLNGSAVSNGNTVLVDFSSLGNYTINLNASNPLCAYDTTFVVQITNAAPDLSSVPDSTTFCLGESVVLNSSAENSTWSYSGSTVSTDSLLSVSVAGLYTIEAGTGNCISIDSIFVVGVNVPTVNISSSTAEFYLCDSLPVNLISSSVSGNNWYFGGSIVDTNQSITVSTEGWYVLGVNNNVCPEELDSVNVLFYSPITAQIATTSQLICPGDTTVLYAPAGSQEWYFNQQLIGTASTQDALLEGWYVLMYTDTACPSSSDSIYITIDDIPTISINNTNTSFCLGDSVQLWTQSVNHNWIYNQTPISSNDSIFAVVSGWYYLESFGTVCSAVTDSVYLSEVSPGVASIQAADTAFCTGDSVLITSQAFNSIWYDQNQVLLSTNQSLYISDAGWYYLSVEETPCPAVWDSLLIYENFVPAGPFIQLSGQQLIITEPNVVGIQWYFDGTLLNGVTNDTLTTSAIGTYSVVLTFANGCQATEEFVYDNSGEEGLMMNSYLFYPNPAESVLFIESVRALMEGDVIEIKDELGRTVQRILIEETRNTVELFVGELSSGTYYIVVNESSLGLFVRQ